ncbi:MAG: hypothetical protein ACLQFI_01695 [Methylocella sp.]
MHSWFVSTTRALGHEIEWLLTPHISEDAAKAFASRALVRGLRVEAGTIPGNEPKMRIGWRTAHHWAQSSNPKAIMGLRKQVAKFALQKATCAAAEEVSSRQHRRWGP